MKRAVLLMMAALLMFTITGCGGQEVARRGDTSSTLYIGEVGAAFSTSFMPWLSRDGVAPTISSMVYSTLLDYDEATDTFNPKLASSKAYLDKELKLIVTEDGQVDYDRLEAVYGGSDTAFIPVRFELNKNATWSDGVPVTAEDVYFTFDLAACQKLSNHAGAARWYGSMIFCTNMTTTRAACAVRGSIPMIMGREKRDTPSAKAKKIPYSIWN